MKTLLLSMLLLGSTHIVSANELWTCTGTGADKFITLTATVAHKGAVTNGTAVLDLPYFSGLALTSAGDTFTGSVVGRDSADAEVSLVKTAEGRGVAVGSANISIDCLGDAAYVFNLDCAVKEVP